MIQKEKLTGVISPIATPFLDEEVSYAGLAENIRKYNDTGLKGYMVLGSNGEFQSLTEEESLKIVDTVQKEKTAEKTLIVGAGRESARATIEFMKKIRDKGADFAAVLTPHYFTMAMTDEALINFYNTIADQSDIPVIIYHAPVFSSGVTVTINMISSLSGHLNIAGMKNTSNEAVLPYLKAVPEGAGFNILCVLSIANYLPDICCELYDLCMSGDKVNASKLNNRVSAFNSKVMGDYGVAGVKTAMNLLGYFGGEPRNPLLPLDAGEVEKLRSYFKEEGIL
ncbi:MAG: dihydrodipicolinate synthase family protein [Planctomycetota bacterium]|jgi:4-hydroxy-2-oxoglutarate aldolase